MKDVLIAFLIALAVGSMLNDWKPQKPTPPQPSASQSQAPSSLPTVEQQAARKLSSPIEELVPKLGWADFERDVIHSASPVLVFFESDSSEPCQRTLPTVAMVSSEVEDTFRVVRVDVLNTPQIARQYNISATPAFAVFKDGQKVDEAVGELSHDNLILFLRKTVAGVGQLARTSQT